MRRHGAVVGPYFEVRRLSDASPGDAAYSAAPPANQVSTFAATGSGCHARDGRDVSLYPITAKFPRVTLGPAE
jgi:hypothetical protein